MVHCGYVKINEYPTISNSFIQLVPGLRKGSSVASYPDPYCIWVSEIMLQQTQVDTVKNYYIRFLETLPDIKSLADADEDLTFKLWEGLGYYRRIRHMQEAARQVMEDYHGIFPDTYDKIITLKGIGAYTASAISSIAFGQEKGVVDGNTLRILSRIYNRQDNIAQEKPKKSLPDFNGRADQRNRPFSFQSGHDGSGCRYLHTSKTRL